MIDDGLKWLFKSFVWSRGIVAAIVLLAVLETVFGWDRVSFLEFTHTLVSHWNVVTGDIFGWLTQWLPVSSPAPYARNLFLLGLVGLGPCIAFLLSDDALAKRKVMKVSVVIGIIGYCLWVGMFWNSEIQLPADTGLLLKIMSVLFLITYPFGFALGAIYGLERTQFGRTQSKAMFTTLLFVGTLELLYHFPKVTEAASNYVSYVERLSNEDSGSLPHDH